MFDSSPIVYLCETDVQSSVYELKGYIQDHSFDEETQIVYYYSSIENGNEIMLSDEFLLEELDVNFEVIRKALQSLDNYQDKQAYIAKLDLGLVRYKAQFELEKETLYSEPVTDNLISSYASKIISNKKLSAGPFSVLLNNVDDYKFQHHMNMKPHYWVNKSGNFFVQEKIEYDYSKDFNDLLDEDFITTYEWGILETSQKNHNISQQQLSQIKQQAAEDISHSLYEAKQKALKTFKQILGEEIDITSNITSYDPEYHSHLTFNSNGYRYDLLFPHPGLSEEFMFSGIRLCSGNSGKYELESGMKKVIETQLPNIKIPSSFKSRKAIVRFLNNIVSHSLDQLYNVQDYEKAMKDIEESYVSQKYWWVYFIKPEIDLQELFG